VVEDEMRFQPDPSGAAKLTIHSGGRLVVAPKSNRSARLHGRGSIDILPGGALIVQDEGNTRFQGLYITNRGTLEIGGQGKNDQASDITIENRGTLRLGGAKRNRENMNPKNYEGRAAIYNFGVIEGAGVIDGTVISQGGQLILGIDASTPPLTNVNAVAVTPDKTTSAVPGSTDPLEPFVSSPDSGMITITGSLSLSSTIVTEKITPSTYGQLNIGRTCTINGPTLNIQLTTATGFPQVSPPAPGLSYFNMILGYPIIINAPFSGPFENNPTYSFTGSKITGYPSAQDIYRLTTISP
jgi:hypothetical protein